MPQRDTSHERTNCSDCCSAAVGVPDKGGCRGPGRFRRCSSAIRPTRAQTAAIAALRQSESRIKAAVEDPDDELHSSAVDLHASASRQHQAVARQLMVAGADISVGQVRSLRTIRERSASSEDPGAEQKATRASRGGWTGAALPPNGQNRAAQPVTPSSKRTSPRISPAP